MKTTLKSFLKEHFSWAAEHTLNDKLKTPKKIKFEILDFPQFYGKPLSEVREHLLANYANRLPDLTTMAYFWEHKDEYPEFKKHDGWRWFYFFGSTLRVRDGGWGVPCVVWGGSSWDRSADWLSSDWGSSFRVVLLEIGSKSDPLESSVSLDEPLALRVKKLEEWARNLGMK